MCLCSTEIMVVNTLHNTRVNTYDSEYNNYCIKSLPREKLRLHTIHGKNGFRGRYIVMLLRIYILCSIVVYRPWSSYKQLLFGAIIQILCQYTSHTLSICVKNNIHPTYLKNKHVKVRLLPKI